MKRKIQIELKETDLGNKENSGAFLDIFTDFWRFTDNMLPSKLFKIYSIVVGYIL